MKKELIKFREFCERYDTNADTFQFYSDILNYLRKNGLPLSAVWIVDKAYKEHLEDKNSRKLIKSVKESLDKLVNH